MTYVTAKSVKCLCECNPQIKYTDTGATVIHNSFDGREAIEWAREILK